MDTAPARNTIDKDPEIVGPTIPGRPRSPLNEKNEKSFDGRTRKPVETLPFCRVRVFARYVMTSNTRGYVGTHQAKEFFVSVICTEDTAWRSKHFLQYLMRQCSIRASDEYPLKVFDAAQMKFELIFKHIVYKNAYDELYTVIPDTEMDDAAPIDNFKRATPSYTKDFLDTKQFDMVVSFECKFSEPLTPLGRVGLDVCPEKHYLEAILQSIMREDSPMVAIQVAISAYNEIKSEYEKFRENLVVHRNRIIYNPKSAPPIWQQFCKISNEKFLKLRERHSRECNKDAELYRNHFQKFLEVEQSKASKANLLRGLGIAGTGPADEVFPVPESTNSDSSNSEGAAAKSAPKPNKSSKKNKSKSKKAETPTDEVDVQLKEEHLGTKRPVPPTNSMVISKKPKMSTEVKSEVEDSQPVPLMHVAVPGPPDFIPLSQSFKNGHQTYVNESRATYSDVAQTQRGRGRGSRGYRRGSNRPHHDNRYAQLLVQRRSIEADLARYEAEMDSRQLPPHRGQPPY